MNKKLIGHIDVDSGMVMVADPCYVLADDASPRPMGRARPVYEDVLQGMTSESGHCDKPHAVFPFGVVEGCFGGDGQYPVYAHINDKGLTCRLEIVFRADDPENSSETA